MFLYVDHCDLIYYMFTCMRMDLFNKLLHLIRARHSATAPINNMYAISLGCLQVVCALAYSYISLSSLERAQSLSNFRHFVHYYNEAPLTTDCTAASRC